MARSSASSVVPNGEFAQRASSRGQIALVLLSSAGAALGLLALLGVAVSPALASLVLLSLISLISLGVFWLPSGVFARPLLSANTTRQEIALTFDDGPSGAQTRSILDVLEARGHRATFFVVGATAERDPALLAEIAQRGHAVENHSWFHSYLTPFMNPTHLAAELERTSALIESRCGKRPRWFRPPVGILSPNIAAAAELAGLDLAGWSGTARDGVASRTIDDALLRLTRALKPGAVLVLHDGAVQGGRVSIAAQLLPRLLDLLAERDLRSVTLEELLA